MHKREPNPAVYTCSSKFWNLYPNGSVVHSTAVRIVLHTTNKSPVGAFNNLSTCKIQTPNMFFLSLENTGKRLTTHQHKSTIYLLLGAKTKWLELVSSLHRSRGPHARAANSAARRQPLGSPFKINFCMCSVAKISNYISIQSCVFYCFHFFLII